MPACPACGAQGSGNYCSNCGVSYATGKARGGMSGCAVAGIVAAAVAALSIPIIGIIAAIAVPNFLNAVQRGKTKRAVDEIQAVALAVEGYAQENGAYPEARSMDELAAYLQPTYIASLPLQDPWENAYRYEAWGRDPDSLGPDTYAIGSARRKGEWEESSLADYEEGRTQGFDADLVYRKGAFLRLPDWLAGDG